MTKNHRTARKPGKAQKAKHQPASPVAEPEPMSAAPEQTVEITAQPAKLTLMQRMFS